jgi:hypothetical protein
MWRILQLACGNILANCRKRVYAYTCNNATDMTQIYDRYETNYILYHSHPLNVCKSVFVIPRVIERVSNRTGSTRLNCCKLYHDVRARLHALALPAKDEKKEECEKIGPPELP